MNPRTTRALSLLLRLHASNSRRPPIATAGHFVEKLRSSEQQQQSHIKPHTMIRRSNAPLVWIDCEMSGLKDTDVLLQIACYITDAKLSILDPIGFNVTISRPQHVLDTMDEWCTNTHAATGLTAGVLTSTTTIDDAGAQLLAYIRKYVPQKQQGLLAGNTVHADKEFLKRECPRVVEWLSYRILDVSSFKEAAMRWCGDDVLAGVPNKMSLHEAGMDIRESIAEARYWKEVLFDTAGKEERGLGTNARGHS